MHAEQRHHGFESHPYDMQPHVEDDPMAVGQHGFYEGTYWPMGHHVPQTNSEATAQLAIQLRTPLSHGEHHVVHGELPHVDEHHANEVADAIIDSDTFHGIYHEMSPYHSTTDFYQNPEFFDVPSKTSKR